MKSTQLSWSCCQNVYRIVCIDNPPRALVTVCQKLIMHLVALPQTCVQTTKLLTFGYEMAAHHYQKQIKTAD